MDRLYDLKQIVGDRHQAISPIIPVSPATFYARVKAGIYPRGFKYGGRRYWTESDVEEMIDVMKSGADDQLVGAASS